MNHPCAIKNQTRKKLFQKSTGKLYPKQSSQGSETCVTLNKNTHTGLSSEKEIKSIPKFSAKDCLQTEALKNSLVLNPHS